MTSGQTYPNREVGPITIRRTCNKTSRGLRLCPLSLGLLVFVIEEGSIAAVAERHNLAASAVSKRLSDLEAALGSSLISRTNRGIEPTAAGIVLASLARNVLNDLDEIYVRMQEYSEGIRGQVRLTANRSSIIGYLPAELKSFAIKHPHVAVRLEERISNSVTRSILENEADIGLFWPVEYPIGLEILPYHVDHSVVITPKDHALASKSSVKFVETLDEEFVGLHEEAVMMLHKAAADVQKTLKLRVQVSSFDAMCGMVSAGLGIGLVPHSCIPSELIGSRLHVIKLDEPWARRELLIGTRSYDSLSAAGKLLFDHLAGRGAQRR
jgi:DNA-binding transcriptional LysR family regulator